MNKTEKLEIVAKIEEEIAKLKESINLDQSYDVMPIIEKLDTIGTRPNDR